MYYVHAYSTAPASRASWLCASQSWGAPNSSDDHIIMYISGVTGIIMYRSGVWNNHVYSGVGIYSSSDYREFRDVVFEDVVFDNSSSVTPY